MSNIFDKKVLLLSPNTLKQLYLRDCVNLKWDKEFGPRNWYLFQEFSVDHDWCAAVKKLLGIIFSGVVYIVGHVSV